jgi:hypothetical protein
MAAAIAAARAGASVHLIEAKPLTGGTVVHGLIHTLGGLYDSAGRFLQDGLPRELAERLSREDAGSCQRRLGRTWVQAQSPHSYAHVTRRWLHEEPLIDLRLKTCVTGVTRNGRRIASVHLFGPEGEERLDVAAAIDASGTAALVRLIDPALLQDDTGSAAGGLIFRLRGVVPGTVDFPKGVGILRALRDAAEAGALPPECRWAWLDAGTTPDEVYVKLFVPDTHPERLPQATRAARDAQAEVVRFLHHLCGFEKCEVAQTGELGVRDGGRIRGEHCLTADDLRQGRRFPDAACRCCWPIEYWHPQAGLSLEYLKGSYYEIPLRALRVAGMDNLFAAGKILSADPQAHASARVVGTCWAMGEAVGKAAAELSRKR